MSNLQQVIMAVLLAVRVLIHHETALLLECTPSQEAPHLVQHLVLPLATVLSWQQAMIQYCGSTLRDAMLDPELTSVTSRN